MMVLKTGDSIHKTQCSATVIIIIFIYDVIFVFLMHPMRVSIYPFIQQTFIEDTLT